MGRKEEEEVTDTLKYKTKLAINAGGEVGARRATIHFIDSISILGRIQSLIRNGHHCIIDIAMIQHGACKEILMYLCVYIM